MKIENDKYYTPIELANYCCDKVLEIIGYDNISEVIEPSVGDGAFLHHPVLTPHFAYDIEPECDSNVTQIKKCDFLEQDIKYLYGRLILGNPPYGRCLSVAQKFYKKSVKISDYIAFILPISQLNNTHSLYEFDLIYSEDLGIVSYSGRNLHCCFNIYKRPDNQNLNSKPVDKLDALTFYRQDAKGYKDINDFDIRICYWGNGSVGKVLNDGENYSAEYKIRIHDTEHREAILNVIKTFDWKSYLNCIAMKKLQQFHIIDVLCNEIPEISSYVRTDSEHTDKQQQIKLF